MEQAIAIANGAPFSKILHGDSLSLFLSDLNEKHTSANLGPDDSIKGQLMSNKKFDTRLVLSDTWISEKEVYPAWTGTLVAYKFPDEKFGDVVKYTIEDMGITYLLEIPKEYQNEKNAILVVNHGFIDKFLFKVDNPTIDALNDAFNRVVYNNPQASPFFSKLDFDALVKTGKLESRGYLVLKIGHSINVFEIGGQPIIVPNEKGSTITYEITDKSQIALLQNFPANDGWYSTDSKFGIPLGNKMHSDDSDARYLYRGLDFIGLLGRANRNYYGELKNIIAEFNFGDLPGRIGALIDTETA